MAEEAKEEVQEQDVQEQITKEFEEMQGYFRDEDTSHEEEKEEGSEGESEDSEAGDSAEGSEEGEGESKATLTEKEKGLIKELREQRAKGKETQEKSSEEIENLKREIQELKEAKTKPADDPWAKVTDTDLETGLIHWQEQYRKAVRDEDKELEQKAFGYIQKIGQVKQERVNKPKEDTSKPEANQEQVLKDFISMDKLAKEAVPDFYKEGTEANDLLHLKAKEFPGLTTLGDLGGLLAGALVILEHPELVAGKVTKTVTKKLEDQINKTLTDTKGTNSKPISGRKLSHQENLELAERIKRGQPVSL